jgi:hypothetical protein
MKASWKVLEKGIYVRGHVFHENSMFPDTTQKPFTMMVDFHRRDYWEPNASALVEPTDENIEIILQEKNEALELVRSLGASLNIGELGLSDQMRDDLECVVELFEIYIRTFHVSTRVCFFARKAQITGNDQDVSKALSTLPDLEEDRDLVSAALSKRDYPHLVYELMDVRRLNSLLEDVGSTLLQKAAA